MIFEEKWQGFNLSSVEVKHLCSLVVEIKNRLADPENSSPDRLLFVLSQSPWIPEGGLLNNIFNDAITKHIDEFSKYIADIAASGASIHEEFAKQLIGSDWKAVLRENAALLG